jgi:hypothetical protein
MSFLNNNDSKYISVRITKKGRNAIARGDFNISYFQVGDSEFDYTSPFTGLTGQLPTPSQRVFAPFDKDGGVKYPYRIDSSENSTTYGTPFQNSGVPEVIRNVMGPAGFVSAYNQFDDTTIECYSEAISVISVSNVSQITVTSGSSFTNCEFITLVFDEFGGTTTPIITGNNSSLIYRITGVTGNTLYLDRTTPNLSALGITGNVNVVCNFCEKEYDPCFPTVNYQGQLNPWSLNVVWTTKPIGADTFDTDENLTGYTSNVHVSTKELLGYTSTGQTFTNFTGGTLDHPTSFTNGFGEEILVEPKHQRCIAVVHYSQLNDVVIDPERFYKYDDYISYDDSTTNTIAYNSNNETVSDTEYFEVFIPFIYYHRNVSDVPGALFKMGSDNYYIKSTKNSGFQILFRYLLDEQGNKVGKVFPNNKTIVFDDQELVALLDYRSNRRYTLPAPKVIPTPSDTSAQNSLLSGSTGQTVWFTYGFVFSFDQNLNALPCNYYQKISLTSSSDECAITTPSNLLFKFTEDDFSKMNINFTNTGFTATDMFTLVQITENDQIPDPSLWRIIYIQDIQTNGYVDPTKLIDRNFIITKSDYDGNITNFFDLETHLGYANYMGDEQYTTQPQFGDEQPFPGSIKLVRATDIEELNFQVSLSSTEFLETQNPTYTSGSEKKITEIALLNKNKEVMVIGKTSIPITRIGSQVFAIKLDF